jgi:hypothetical protein
MLRKEHEELGYLPINFETALGDLAALVNWVVPAPLGMTLRGLVGTSELRLQIPEGRYAAAVAVNVRSRRNSVAA